MAGGEGRGRRGIIISSLAGWGALLPGDKRRQYSSLRATVRKKNSPVRRKTWVENTQPPCLRDVNARCHVGGTPCCSPCCYFFWLKASGLPTVTSSYFKPIVTPPPPGLMHVSLAPGPPQPGATFMVTTSTHLHPKGTMHVDNQITNHNMWC